MFKRLLTPPTPRSFFLFGARGTGKTSLVKGLFGVLNGSQEVLYIDLLNLELEAKYQLNSELLYKELSALPPETSVVIIDEVQKVPQLLDVVHRTIKESSFKFVLTGSSSRKLKLGGANLLAGLAVVFNHSSAGSAIGQSRGSGPRPSDELILLMHIPDPRERIIRLARWCLAEHLERALVGNLYIHHQPQQRTLPGATLANQAVYSVGIEG